MTPLTSIPYSSRGNSNTMAMNTFTSYIVFDGDQAELDPSWTSTLSGKLWPHLVEMGFDNPPSKSFVEKSEWLENPLVKPA